MELQIDQLAAKHGVNLSQLQRQTGMTMGKLRRYWYNETRSAEIDALETLVLFFQRFDPSVTVSDLFTTPGPHDQPPGA